MAESTSEKILRNTALNVAGRAWQVALGVVVAPYIIRRVGIERYGLWAIATVLVGYVSLLDFGIRDAFGKFVADCHARGDDEELDRLVNSGLLFYLLLAIVVAVVGLASVEEILTLFRIPSALLPDAVFVCSIAILVFAAANVVNVFGAIPWGMQRMGVCNATDVCLTVPYVVGLVALLETGHGVRGLAVNAAIMAVLGGVVKLVVAKRLVPRLSIRPWRASRKAMRELAAFGIKRWVAQVEEIVTYQTDKLLISRFCSVALVGYYQLGYSLTTRMRELPALLTSALVPAVSGLAEQGEKERILEVYVRGSKYLMAAALPLMAFLFAAAHLIMALWMGPGYGQSAQVIRLLSVAFAISFVPACLTAVAIGLGRPDFQAKAGGAQAVLNLALSIWLVIKMGFAGVLVATVISVTVSTTYIVLRFNRFLGYPTLLFCTQTFIKPTVIALCCAAALLGINHAWVRWESLDRLRAAAWLIAESCVFFAAYAVLLVKSRTLTKDELWLILSKLLPRRCPNGNASPQASEPVGQ